VGQEKVQVGGCPGASKGEGCSQLVRTQIFAGTRGMDSLIVEIAGQLEKEFLGPSCDQSAFWVFLCGGGKPTQMRLRRHIGDRISATKSKYRYKVYYPEDMFIELILGHSRADLLSLENILAESVHAVAILLESPGTFTELGAFANHHKLKDKLIVVTDPAYGTQRSFINLGPIRYLQTNTRSHVHYLTVDETNTRAIASVITESTRKVAVTSPPRLCIENPIGSYEFFLALIYTLDPIPRKTVFEIVAELSKPSEELALLSANTVVNVLVNTGRVACISDVLSVTPLGSQELLCADKTKAQRLRIMHILTRLRYDALNRIYRRKSRMMGGPV
jgi:hypothetical protein